MGYKRKTFVIILFFIFLSFCHTVYADTTNLAWTMFLVQHFVYPSPDWLPPMQHYVNTKRSKKLKSVFPRGY